MPAMSNLLVRSDVDGTSDITFYPLKDNPFPQWRTNISGTPLLGQSRIETQWENLKGGAMRINVKVIKPILEVIPAGTVNSSGVQAAPMVADDEFVSVTWKVSPRGSNDTRAELQRWVAHLLVGASGSTGVGISPVAGGAHAFRDVVSSSPVPYAISNLLFPGA